MSSAASSAALPRAPRRAHQTAHRTHRVRALLFLTLLVATPIMWAAHVFGTLLLWPAAVVTGGLVLMTMVLRRAATIQRRAAARARLRASDRTMASRGMAGRGMASRGANGQPTTVRRTFPARSAVAASPGAAAAPAEAAMKTPAETMLSSQDAVTEVIVLDGMWEPVKVPPPTYTMKARADRPAAAEQVALPESDSSPVKADAAEGEADRVIELPEDDELAVVLERRRAAGE